jgi:hypothetical protein
MIDDLGGEQFSAENLRKSVKSADKTQLSVFG